MRRAALAAAIDHTLLRATATAAQIEALCREAHEHGFFSVCVQPCRVALARRTLTTLAASTRVCTVIGFPLGANTPAIKAAEAAQALADGADELDMVIALGALRDGDESAVLADIRGVVAAGAGTHLTKVILETALLTPEEIDAACRLSVAAGAQYVKTSTGFGPGGATVAAVQRMRAAVGPDFGVKASGGIADAATARAMLAAGASRLGASASVAIVAGWDEDVPIDMVDRADQEST
ncbi:deoxyribose-phosphate aldolase [Nannocystis sp. SCPEA4]|uniref:deoxyribose-phosphate aldolase n=1 Tax=Nannocystis sp. SCPEA4 TaxID=2996787 RepID=UPI00226FBD0B|nr:deoxyribose-phosphate aldolase [Nannocystis sp. SCPEA4]MCY1055299.1 deoxyribose-phosphate aldolase [Nannocystis sp. SCPEA4]